jgi:hypothetical protein
MMASPMHAFAPIWVAGRLSDEKHTTFAKKESVLEPWGHIYSI